MFAAFARELSCPGCFGHTWDALADCLHDRPAARQANLRLDADGMDVRVSRDGNRLTATLTGAEWPVPGVRSPGPPPVPSR
ncbi:barstar family protein [Streptomyces sp. NBC_00028]|uniref:barstar family protein n=1 Tax=Streptomyces sp. NBC_00028 TaxID=2975624 RepID=UPI00386FEED3